MKKTQTKKKNTKAVATAAAPVKTPARKNKKAIVIAAIGLVVAILAVGLFFAPSIGGRVARHGDTVAIHFAGYLDGERFPGGTGHFNLRLGSGQFVPGFEEQLIGARKGEVREIRLRFPDQYVPGLAGQEVTFIVTVNEIK